MDAMQHVELLPDITTLCGGFAVVWSAMGYEHDLDGAGPNTGFETGIFAQVFDNFGNKVGREFQVNVGSLGDQFNPEVKALPDGGFAVSWVSVGGVNETTIDPGLGPLANNLYQKIIGTGQAMNGSQDADLLQGTNIADVIAGQSGDDVIRGRGGEDILVGGSGADTFDFDRLSDRGDIIQDFDHAAGDRIDLSDLLDADTNWNNGVGRDIADYVRISSAGGTAFWRSTSMALLEGRTGRRSRPSWAVQG